MRQFVHSNHYTERHTQQGVQFLISWGFSEEKREAKPRFGAMQLIKLGGYKYISERSKIFIIVQIEKDLRSASNSQNQAAS